MTPKACLQDGLIAGSILILLSACVTGRDASQPSGRDRSPAAAASVFNVLPAARPTPDGGLGEQASRGDAKRYFPYEDGARYVLRTAAGSSSAIALEPGEVLASYATADGAKWTIRDVVSEDQTRLLIEPAEPNLSTELVINTDKRSYLIKATSRQGAPADAAIAWTYHARATDRPTAIAQAGSRAGDAETANGFSLLATWLGGLSQANASDHRGCRLCRDPDDHGENDHDRGHDSMSHH